MKTTEEILTVTKNEIDLRIDDSGSFYNGTHRAGVAIGLGLFAIAEAIIYMTNQQHEDKTSPFNR